jgi:hypothetical protein
MNIIFAENVSETNNCEFIFIRSTAQIGEMPAKFIVFEECMTFKIQTLNTVPVTTLSSSLSNFLEPPAPSYISAPDIL